MQAAPFALRPAERGDRSAVVREGAHHDLCGRILFVLEEAWVVDVGIAVYGNRLLPPNVAAGDMVAGDAYLGIESPAVYDDAFFRAAPPLRYSWRIEGVRLETTPWIEVSPRSFIRDESRVGYVDVEQTNATERDDGHGRHYLLDCALLGGPMLWHEGR